MGPEPKLPGLPYSPRQLFWVSYARLQCALMRPAALKNTVIFVRFDNLGK